MERNGCQGRTGEPVGPEGWILLPPDLHAVRDFVGGTLMGCSETSRRRAGVML